MSNKDWTDKLPGMLEGYTEAAPDGLWDAVLAGVAPQKRRVAAAWWFAGGGILAAAAAIALFVLLRPVTPVPSVTVVPGDVVAVVDEEPIRRSEPAKNGRVEPVSSAKTSPVEVVSQNNEDVTVSIDTPAQIEEEPAVVPEEEAVDNQSEEPSASPIEEVPPTKKPLPIKVQISLSATGYMGQMAQNSSSGVGLPTTPGMRPNAAPPTKSSTGAGGEAAIPMMLGRNKASTTDATHRQSARFAFGVRVGLYGRWGVESGIVSSTLTSEFISRAGNNLDYTTREIRYLGIPLYASYNLYQTNRVGIMLNAGPMYEFSKKTLTVTESYLSGTKLGETTDNTLYNDTKWSMNLGAALQLRTGKHGALYVQPGFSCHFLDNSTLETFYTAHPAAFSITIGYNFLF